MATKIITLKGKAKWPKLFEANRDKASFHEAYDGAYTLALFLESDQMATFKDSGSRLRPKVTEDGIYIQPKRKHKDIFESASGAPKVFNSDNEPWDNERDGFIGNDSEVEVQLSVYDTKMGKGTRLEAVKVTNLVPYTRSPEAASEGPKIGW